MRINDKINSLLALCCFLGVLFLVSCSSGKAGNYVSEGIYVRATSGRHYLYTTDTENNDIVLMFDESKEGCLFDTVTSGCNISAKTSVFQSNKISYHVSVSECAIKKQKFSTETIEEILQKVQLVDALYSKYTISGQYILSESNRHYLIETGDSPRYILLKDESANGLFDDLATGDAIIIGPGTFLHNGISYYAYTDICKLDDAENSPIDSNHVAEIERIDALYSESQT